MNWICSISADEKLHTVHCTLYIHYDDYRNGLKLYIVIDGLSSNNADNYTEPPIALTRRGRICQCGPNLSNLSS